MVFDQTMAATNALRQLQGFPFFNKAMRIDYAKTVSDAVAKTMKGYVPRYKRKAEVGPAKPDDDSDDDDQQQGSTKRIADGSVGGAQEAQKPMAHNGAQPNKTIIASELPANCTAEHLAALFSQYRGFLGTRAVTEKQLVRGGGLLVFILCTVGWRVWLGVVGCRLR